MSEFLLKQAAIAKAFEKIGKTNGTGPFESTDNRATIAHEYFVADKLASIADKRKKEAKKQAQEAGILGDDYVPGVTKEVYSNEHFAIVAKTNNPAERIDKTILANELVKLLGKEKANAVLAKATVENNPATSFSFVAR